MTSRKSGAPPSGDRLLGIWDKVELAARWADSPLLRLLLYSQGFRWVVGVGLAIAAGTVVLFPRVWRTTPAWVVPEIRVSVFQMLKCRQHMRGAMVAEEQGRMVEAVAKWRQAYGSNPGSVEAVRGWTRLVSRGESKGAEKVNDVTRGASWLIRLSGTNAVDTAVAAQSLLRCNLVGPALRTCELFGTNPPPVVERVYVKALLQAGRGEEFGMRIGRVLGSGGAGSEGEDAELPLYVAAHTAGWGTERASGFRELAEAEAGPARVLAMELEYAARLRRRDAARCAELLSELDREGATTVDHHLQYWSMLDASSRAEEARRLAGSVVVEPRTLGEAVRLARGCADRGGQARAVVVVETWLAENGWTDSVDLPWTPRRLIETSRSTERNMLADLITVRAESLIQLGEWDRLRELAFQIRLEPNGRERLGGYSDFLTGLAEASANRAGEARKAFEEMVEEGIPDSAVAMDVTEALILSGYPDAAKSLLQQHRGRLEGSPRYEQLVKRANAKLPGPAVTVLPD